MLQVNTLSLPVEFPFLPLPLGGDLLIVLPASDGDVSDLWRLKYGENGAAPSLARKFLSLLTLPGLLLLLLELVLGLPGLREAGKGFSVLISSAFNKFEVDTALDRY